MKTRLLVACMPGLLAFFAMSCSSPDFCVGAACEVVDGGDDGGGGDGGKDASGDATVHDGGADADAMGQGDTSPPGCSASEDIALQLDCVADGNGLFVNGLSGNDTAATGTKESPYKTIGAAVAASSSGGRVFICATMYAEPVKLTANVSLYGGFDCSSWAYLMSNVPKVAPSTAGYALDLESVSGVTIEDLEFDSIPGVNPGDSSVAVFANTSTAAFNRVTAMAGDGGSTPEKAGTALNYPSADTHADAGIVGAPSVGEPEQDCRACLVATPAQASIGGASGASGGSGSGGGPTIQGGDYSGAGGMLTGGSCANGMHGADGLDAGGGAASDASGMITGAAWAPAVGLPGEVAPVAQGGGGGSGAPSGFTGGGGGGGCGGCGGGGGLGGSGGGSSIAVLSKASTLTFSACALTAGNASSGGPGGDGQPGQLGGAGGGTGSGSGCSGGIGGSGSSGGGGAGGPGGISAGVGYTGPAPTPPDLSGSTVNVSKTVASGGPGGSGGNPAAALGKQGMSASVVAL